jgi:hypothetical protein
MSTCFQPTHLYLKKLEVEGRTKLYFTTEKQDPSDDLAEWILYDTTVDVKQAIATFGFAYPKEPLKTV